MNRRSAVERITLLLGGGALSPQLTAAVMGQVMAKVKGKADGKVVSEVVREKLS